MALPKLKVIETWRSPYFVYILNRTLRRIKRVRHIRATQRPRFFVTKMSNPRNIESPALRSKYDSKKKKRKKTELRIREQFISAAKYLIIKSIKERIVL